MVFTVGVKRGDYEIFILDLFIFFVKVRGTGLDEWMQHSKVYANNLE